MLSNSIAAPTASELREARLGLLIELVVNGDSHDTHGYEGLRAARAAAGECWPSRSQLSRAYGTWLRALEAATALASGSGAGAPSHRERPHASQRYARRDLLLAIQRSHIALGTSPSPGAYQRWRSPALRAAREHARAAPPIPSVTAIKRRFGTWTRAVTLATAAENAHRPGL